MGQHVIGPPDPGTYRYVLARWDWPVGHTYTVANYGETRTTRAVRWPRLWDLPDGRGNPNAPKKPGDLVTMVFVQDRYLRDRCMRLGWHDITDRWFHLLEHPGGGPTPGVPIEPRRRGEVVARFGAEPDPTSESDPTP